ncbi:CPBP family intramembrane glutamic endopeptidase [Edaphobacter albus]|uniref:CPBP family intramembrane glutamic endopeptidase n=1 Tax=Edaphobacter sp. 4G125 TaxID=2763071 RepID=UPI00164675B5|nr:type II CAAX endopeptidase family protein [Edaphobacter sp. 4G125]QNI38301.1 CPBP family intramembrane metalloprotease [Edaphobacter sp. 4G125]
MRQSSLSRWYGFARVLLFFAACAVLLIVASSYMPKRPAFAPQIALGIVTSIATWFLTWIFCRWDGIRLKDVGATFRIQSLSRLLFGATLGIALVAVQAFFIALIAHARWTRVPHTNAWTAIVPLFAYLSLACREELAFRGYPLRRMESFFGSLAAQLIVAIVFALEHVGGGYTWGNAFLGVFVGSLLFGMAALATRGLAVPIGLHVMWNFGQWVLGEKESLGLWKVLIDDRFQARAQVVGMVTYLLGAGIVILAFWWQYQKSRASKPLP